MTYFLAIGDRTYSSWSLRGWLLFEKFDIPVRVQTARIYTDELPQLLSNYAPAKLVPVMKTGELVVQDSLDIAETLNDRHPDRGMWPADADARAFARSLAAEMHSGFTDLRGDCAMNLAHQWVGFEPSDAVLADCARMEMLWAMARERFGGDGPWLFGEYSIADAFFAPAATRFATYDLPRSAASQAYIDAHLADPVFRRWRAMGWAQKYPQPAYDKGLPITDWPGPTPLKAQESDGPSENTACPYSGDPITDCLSIDGRVFGFCNPFCRDKTLADPAAWPAFMEIYQK